MMAAKKTKPPKMDNAMIPPVFNLALAFDPDLTDELSAISLSKGLVKLLLVVEIIVGFLVLLVLVCFLKGEFGLLVVSGILEVEVEGVMDRNGVEGS